MKKISRELISLNSKDQKIFAQLFRDGRAHYSTIAKKTHISKDAVKYRIDKIIESGVTTGITTIINVRKLGWSSSIVFFKLMNLDKVKIRKFISYLTKSPFVVEILECAGRWDFAARFYHKDTQHLNQLLSELETKFLGLIDNHQIFFITKNIILPYNALFEKYKFKLPERKPISYKPDNFDLKILSAISSDGRKPLARLQKELKENRMTIYNRINKMLKAGIIHSFRPNMFTEKLGLHWYVINLKLNNHSEAKTKAVVNMLKEMVEVNFIMTGFGLSDIIFYIQVRHLQDLQNILYMIREQFSKDIKSVESDIIIKDYKWDFFPKGFLQKIKE